MTFPVSPVVSECSCPAVLRSCLRSYRATVSSQLFMVLLQSQSVLTRQIIDVREIGRLYWWCWFIILEPLFDVAVIERQEAECCHEILAGAQFLGH